MYKFTSLHRCHGLMVLCSNHHPSAHSVLLVLFPSNVSVVERLHHTVSYPQQVCVLLHTECTQHYDYMRLQVASSQRICCQSMIFPSHLCWHASRVVATPTVYWHLFRTLTPAISTRSSLVALSKDQCGEQGILSPIVLQLNLASF